jgi:UDP-glucose 4-epimerase
MPPMTTSPRQATQRGRPLKDARVLITGVSGFVGRALCKKLQGMGAIVVGTDLVSYSEAAGERPASMVEFYQGDLSDPGLLKLALPGCSVVFNLAGRCGHLNSMEEPLADHHSNATAQLALLEGCRRWAPEAHVIFASTRQVYGAVTTLPVAETHPPSPVDVNGIHKMAAEHLHLLYSRCHGLRSTIVRLTNTYGPGMNIDRPGRSFLGEWLRVLLRGEPFMVLGSGAQLRDLNHVEDVVDAFVRIAQADGGVDREIFNLGAKTPVSLLKLAKKLVRLTGGKVGFRLDPFPDRQLSIDIGDYWGDYTKIRNVLGWEPKIGLEEGLGELLAAADKAFGTTVYQFASQPASQ